MCKDAGSSMVKWWSPAGRLAGWYTPRSGYAATQGLPLHTHTSSYPPRYGGEGEPASANSIACSSACPRISTRIEPPRTSQSAAERTSWPMFVDTIGRTRSPCKSKT